MSALMIQGVSSSAGKSLVTTALARALRRRGVDVAPFKAQNMSNNARVIAGGGEIGTAQYMQALAAGLEPDVRMNPILVKPEGDNRSQVVVLGKPDLALSRRPWRERAQWLWPVIERALGSLLDEHRLLLLEGAGSPAEINLRDTDLANMRAADAAGARVLLVADIDRGGAFAHLYGTWALLRSNERARLAGFVLNKFRGDACLLSPGRQRLTQLTGVPTLGVLPWLEHGLPDEDGAAAPPRLADRRSVAVIRYPTSSNLDEFKPLEQVAALSWTAWASEVAEADLVILPGSKHVAADLAWLKRSGLARAVRQRAQSGGRVLGICGGMQMLGERLEDESGFDGAAEGLGLLPLHTTFVPDKRTEKTPTTFVASLTEPWAALAEKPLTGYQIRHGRSQATGPVEAALPDALGFLRGSVLGIAVHGMFEQPELVEALLGEAPSRSLEDTFEALADAVEEHLNIDALTNEVGVP